MKTIGSNVENDAIGSGIFISVFIRQAAAL